MGLRIWLYNLEFDSASVFENTINRMQTPANRLAHRTKVQKCLRAQAASAVFEGAKLREQGF